MKKTTFALLALVLLPLFATAQKKVATVDNTQSKLTYASSNLLIDLGNNNYNIFALNDLKVLCLYKVSATGISEEKLSEPGVALYSKITTGNQKIAYSTGKKQVRIFEVQGQHFHSFDVAAVSVGEVALHPSKSILYYVYNTAYSSYLAAYDYQKKEKLAETKLEHISDRLVFLEKANQLLSIDQNLKAQLFDDEKLSEVKSAQLEITEALPNKASYSLALSADQQKLALGGASGKAAIINLSSLTLEKNISVVEKSLVDCLAFSADGKYLYTFVNETFGKWDLSTGKSLSAVKAENSKFKRCLISGKTGSALLFGYDDISIWKW